MVNEVESKIEEVVSSNLLEVNLGQKEARTKQIKDLVPLVFFFFRFDSTYSGGARLLFAFISF